jgi:hypothetical protein
VAVNAVVGPASAIVCGGGVDALPAVYGANERLAGFAPIVLTEIVTPIEIWLEPPKTEIALAFVIVPGVRPVGSAVTVSVEGVVPFETTCPLILNHATFEIALNATPALVELVRVKVWLTAPPPDCAEKLNEVLSGTMLCAWTSVAAAAIRIANRLRRHNDRFNVILQVGVWAGRTGRRSNNATHCTAGASPGSHKT